jgi:epoxyqueuosine reductase
MTSSEVKLLAHECGFELAGIAQAGPSLDAGRYLDWASRGLAGKMAYLADARANLRTDPKHLLPSARSVVCVGKLYNAPEPYSTSFGDSERGWISRYAWGTDYHALVRSGLEQLVARMRRLKEFEYKICVDTAPLLERSYARDAGLGWIGKNTCLINQHAGSWFFLGELLVSLELEAGATPAGRCGSCTRCINACPTEAIVPRSDGSYELDSRLCISYFTIELKGAIPEEHRPGLGRHVFGCDICQDVCPWNSRAATTLEQAFRPVEPAPRLELLARLSEVEFRAMFKNSPVTRARYTGFLRNVAVAMGNSGEVRFVEPLQRLAANPDEVVAEHARWALSQLETRSL